MTIYEIDKKIMECIDPETGEILNDKLYEFLDEKEHKIKNVAQWVVNEKASAEAYKKQKQHFAELQKVAENRIASLEKYLSSVLEGQKWEADDNSVKVTFRKSESLEIADSVDLFSLPETCYKTKTEACKDEIKKLVKAGNTFEGITLVENQNISVK